MIFFRYKERAKEGKKQERECLETKFDSRGRSLASVENEKISRETHLNQMVKRIKSSLSEANDLGKLKHQNFFLMHINILCSVSKMPKITNSVTKITSSAWKDLKICIFF